MRQWWGVVLVGAWVALGTPQRRVSRRVSIDTVKANIKSGKANVAAAAAAAAAEATAEPVVVRDETAAERRARELRERVTSFEQDRLLKDFIRNESPDREPPQRDASRPALRSDGRGGRERLKFSRQQHGKKIIPEKESRPPTEEPSAAEPGAAARGAAPPRVALPRRGENLRPPHKRKTTTPVGEEEEEEAAAPPTAGPEFRTAEASLTGEGRSAVLVDPEAAAYAALAPAAGARLALVIDGWELTLQADPGEPLLSAARRFLARQPKSFGNADCVVGDEDCLGRMLARALFAEVQKQDAEAARRSPSVEEPRSTTATESSGLRKETTATRPTTTEASDLGKTDLPSRSSVLVVEDAAVALVVPEATVVEVGGGASSSVVSFGAFFFFYLVEGLFLVAAVAGKVVAVLRACRRQREEELVAREAMIVTQERRILALIDEVAKGEAKTSEALTVATSEAARLQQEASKHLSRARRTEVILEQQRRQIDDLSKKIVVVVGGARRASTMTPGSSPEETAELEALREHNELLKRQLKNAGVEAIDEVVSFAEAKDRLRAAAERLMAEGGGDQDTTRHERELDKWDEFIRCHPEHVRELTRELEAFRASQADASAAALRVVRTHVPPTIWRRGLNLAGDSTALLNPKAAQRLFKNPVLWLTRASKNRIAKTHVADLRGRYHFGPQLSVLELRAVLAAVPPDAFDSTDTPKAEKRAWRASLEAKLREKLQLRTPGREKHQPPSPDCYGPAAAWADAVANKAASLDDAPLDVFPFPDDDGDGDGDDIITTSEDAPGLVVEETPRGLPRSNKENNDDDAPAVGGGGCVKETEAAVVVTPDDKENHTNAGGGGHLKTPPKLRRTKSAHLDDATKASPRTALASILNAHPRRRVD